MPDSLHDIGREALLEITSADTIGAEAGQKDEGDGVVSVYFETLMTGYPGWHWTVSIASLDGQDPSVLETELTPAEGALLAPDWVPWSDRLADYKAAQDALGEATADAADADSGDSEADDADTESDDDESDDDDDDLGSDVVHGGDVDGVDIDELDDAAGSDESESESNDDDDSDEPLSDEDIEENEKTY
jgi:hypothetical protein